MHRINTPTATSNNRFTEGDPTIPIQPTVVSADWLNAVQEELVSVIEKAGLTLDAANNAQVFAAIQQLISLKTALATVEKAGLVKPDGSTITVDGTGMIKAHAQKYDLCEFYYFRNPKLKAGMQPAQGGVVSNAATLYPEAWAYLQSAEGRALCKTESEWQAMTQATWATLADGTKVGWDGIGGAPFYVQDLAAGTLRVPDLRGMSAEAAGHDGLTAGGVHGDCIRDIRGKIGNNSLTSNPFWTVGGASDALKSSGAFTWTNTTNGTDVDGVQIYFNYNNGTGPLEIDSSRVVPTGNTNKVRAWGALACCFLGQPA